MRTKEEQNRLSKQHWQNNREYYRERQRSNRQRKKQFVWEYLLLHSCIDCGEKDPLVLDFDHVRGEKSFSISDAIRNKKTVERILQEIEKCEVRCSNCHRRKTARQFGWHPDHLDSDRTVGKLSFGAR